MENGDNFFKVKWKSLFLIAKFMSFHGFFTFTESGETKVFFLL